MKNINKDKPVMVTGATGYVAGWLVKKLLQEGFTVHAPVRNPENQKKIQHLLDMEKTSPGNLKFFKGDLLKEGSYTESMKNCSVVFHTASPFTSDIKDPKKELIDPALMGTKNVLSSVDKTDSVSRVVLTSSVAAIYGDNADLEDTPNGVFTEEMWNTTSSLNHKPYSNSKTLAEKEAWRINKEQNRWKLVVINPSLVIGPGTNADATSESFNIIKQFGNGKMKAGAPKMGLGAVDVREVAEAHFNAAFIESVSGRHIVSGHNTDLLEMAKTLLPKYGDKYPIPRKPLPKTLLWLVGPLINKNLSRKVISKNVNLPWKADNTKSKKELEINYRPLSESMNDLFQQLIDNNEFKKN